MTFSLNFLQNRGTEVRISMQLTSKLTESASFPRPSVYLVRLLGAIGLASMYMMTLYDAKFALLD